MGEETFGEMLRRLRLAAELSLRELGKQVGLDYTYLSKIENDRLPPPSFKAIKRIAAALGADIEELTSMTEPSKRYMARLDQLSEAIGHLHQANDHLSAEVAALRTALLGLFKASDAYRQLVAGENCGCVSDLSTYKTASTDLQQWHDTARMILNLRPSGFVVTQAESKQAYVYEDGIWWHRCERSQQAKAESINWNGYLWLLGSSGNINVTAIDFCPWCGTELQDMPKEEGPSQEDMGY